MITYSLSRKMVSKAVMGALPAIVCLLPAYAGAADTRSLSDNTNPNATPSTTPIVIDGNSLSNNTTPNATQSTMDIVINNACARGVAYKQGKPVTANGQPATNNAPAFQSACEAVVAASRTPSQYGQAQNAVNQVTPNQFVAFNTQSTRLTGAQMGQLQASIGARLDSLFAGLANRAAPAYASLQSATGGSAGADNQLVGPFGVWFSNTYNMGAVNNSFNQLGYDFGNWGLTVGADYRATQQLAIGTAFTYQMYNADFANSQGHSETNMYTGTIYAAYTPTDNLHFDASASYGGNDYETTRNINYVIGATQASSSNPLATPPNSIHTQAKSNPGGYHYSFNFRTGYNINVDALTIEPYARFNYYTLTVDPYTETGGDGWGLRVSQQNADSLITTLGSQFSYALSYSWGVLLPQFHAEWHHQYKNNAQATSASFLGDPLQQQFGIVTTGPTRNFATVGGRLAVSVGHGVSAVLGYDALLGYQDINSQRVTLSARMDF